MKSNELHKKENTYLPEENNKRPKRENEINHYTLHFKNILSKEVKDLKNSIDNFKFQVEPVEMKMEEEKKKLLKDKLRQIKVKKDSERKARFNKLNFLRKNYSNLMILQEMTKRCGCFVNMNMNNNRKIIDNSFSIQVNRKCKERNNHLSNKKSSANVNRRNNNLSMFLTTFRQESSTEATSFNIKNNNQCQRSSNVFKVSSKDNIKSIKQKASSAFNHFYNYNNHSYRGGISNSSGISHNNSNWTSRNYNINENNRFINQGGLTKSMNSSSMPILKYKSSIENIFKRTASFQSRYPNIKSRLSLNRLSNSIQSNNEDNDSIQPLSRINNLNLVNAIKSTKQLEHSSHKLSFAINSQREDISKVKMSLKESIDKGIKLQVNPEKEEFDGIRSSILDDEVEKKGRKEQNEYVIQMGMKNKDFNELSSLNNDVIYMNRKYIIKRLGMDKDKIDNIINRKDKKRRLDNNNEFSLKVI